MKISPFLKDIVITALTSVVTIISVIFVIRFLAKGLGPEEFGAYSLARRVIANIIPFSTLAVGVSLARYIALSDETRQRGVYLIASLLIIAGPTLIILLVVFCWRMGLTSLIFHDSKYLTLLYASLVMTVGYGLYTVLYAYYRGMRKMNRANLWQLCAMAVFPLIISYCFSQQADAAFIVFLMGLSLFVSLLPLISIFKNIKGADITGIAASAKELLKYGIPRTPGGLAFAGLLTMGPYLASCFGSLEEAGYFVVGQSVFRIMEASVVAFGLVALPRVARIFAEGKEDFLSRRISDIVSLIFHLGLFTTIQIYIWSRLLVLAWLGPEYSEAVPIMRMLIISLAPYLAYVLLRSIIDAVEVKAVNTWNLFVSLVIGVVLALVLASFGMGVMGIAVGSMIGFLVLGGLTVLYIWRRFGFEFGNTFPCRVILANGLILLLTCLAYKWVFDGAPSLTAIGKLIVMEILLFGTYLALLRRWKVGWMEEIMTRINLQNRPGSGGWSE